MAIMIVRVIGIVIVTVTRAKIVLVIGIADRSCNPYLEYEL